MKFNPEDGQITGPRCRNCHRGSSGCGACHNEAPYQLNDPNATDEMKVENGRASITELFAAMFQMIGQMDTDTVHMYTPYTDYNMLQTSNDLDNQISQSLFLVDKNIVGQIKQSRSVEWTSTLRTVDGANVSCGDDGLSWPHRTLGWKMLKDDLFGIDIGDPDNDGTGDSDLVAPGSARRGTIGTGMEAHDLDSVCLDCHNPTIWNASKNTTDPDDPTKNTHFDSTGSDVDDFDDDLLMRGLP